MAHAIAPNVVFFGSNEKFQTQWKLTRQLLGAGWRYKASSDGLLKETTGDFVFDKWAVGGATNTTTFASSNDGDITALASNIQTFFSSGGTFTADCVGRFLQISGAADQNNNGTFRIVEYVAADTIKIYNPAGASSDANDGALNYVELHGGSTITVSAVVNGIATLTGLTGLVVPTASSRGSEGNRLTIVGANDSGNNGTFIITEVVSTTSCKIINAAAVTPDANDGAILWTESDPSLQTYPSGMTGANNPGGWICLQGPSTLKILIGSNLTTGTFRRGENVTQQTTGATGEITGVVMDPDGGEGYIVVFPRENGSGAGPFGWSDTDIIDAAASPTGSGASVTPTEVKEFIREIVWWRNGLFNGHIYYQCIDADTETATTATTGRFSTLAALGTCTAVIAPGGAAGSLDPQVNGFPTWGTFVVLGRAGTGTVSVATNATDWLSNDDAPNGYFHVMCANAMTRSGLSADGSWTILASNTGYSPGSFLGCFFHRLDNHEDGDVDPYIFYFNNWDSAYGRTRIQSRTHQSSSSGGQNLDWGWLLTQSSTSFMGFRRRGWMKEGVSRGDDFQEFQAGIMSKHASDAGVMRYAATDNERLACTFVETRVREPCMVFSYQVSSNPTGGPPNRKMRKGSPRWIYLVMGTVGGATFDGKRWVSTCTSSATSPGSVVGPWDTASIPLSG